MFFVLGICILLGAFLLLNAVFTFASSLLWRVIGPRAKHLTASTTARLIFGLRVGPAIISAAAVLLLLAPAYLIYEPRHGFEEVSYKLWILSLFSLAGIAFAVARGVAGWRQTRRLTAGWLQQSTEIETPELNVPAYRIEHRFPLIAVVGALRPRLFVAQQIFDSLTPAELAAALRHELGHLWSRDNLKRHLLRACNDLFLVLPLGRNLDAAWNEAVEAAADEFAAGKDRRTGLDLASALVKIARMVPPGARPAMPAGAFLVGRENSRGFKERVKRLVTNSERQPSQPATNRLVKPTTLLIAAACLVLTFTLVQPEALESVHHLIEHTVRFLS